MTRRGVTIAGAEPGGRPLATPTLVGLNVAVFAWTVATSGSVSRNDRAPLFQEWALVPDAVADGEWWRLLTGGFLHFGPIHLLFNMMALWVIGRDIEPALGRARFLAVYLVSLLGASTAVMLLSVPNALVAGASGAVFGLMGALAVLLRRLRIPLGQVGGLIAINLVITFVLPGISVAGHLGGLLTGAIATAALVYAPADRRVPVQTAALAGLTLLLLAVARAAHGGHGLAERWRRRPGGAHRLGDVLRIVAEVQPAEHQHPLGAVRGRRRPSPASPSRGPSGARPAPARCRPGTTGDGAGRPGHRRSPRRRRPPAAAGRACRTAPRAPAPRWRRRPGAGRARRPFRPAAGTTRRRLRRPPRRSPRARRAGSTRLRTPERACHSPSATNCPQMLSTLGMIRPPSGGPLNATAWSSADRRRSARTR